jgi:GH18 family chitinase
MNSQSGIIRLFLILPAALLFSCNQQLSRPHQIENETRSTFKVVGYLPVGNFSQIDQIELSKLTHLDIAFANPDSAGHLKIRNEEGLSAIVEKGHDAGLQVYLSIAGGGINEELAANWVFVLQPENRTKFIREIITFTQKYHLDGVDVDIEWNLLPKIGDLYTPFVLELRDALHLIGKGISSALNVAGLHQAITREALQAYDFINVMVYDKTGIWRPEKPGPHSPYSYALEALKYWTEERKIPPVKLTLGVPFYGHDFDKIKYINYRDIVKIDPKYAYQDEFQSTYYDGIPTIVKKTQLARQSFGGIMIWQIGGDAKGDLSLLRAIDQTLNSYPCKNENLQTYFKDEDNDGYGDAAKPIQACQASPNYVLNRLDCDDTDKKINPKAVEIRDGKDNNCDELIE